MILIQLNKKKIQVLSDFVILSTKFSIVVELTNKKLTKIL